MVGRLQGLEKEMSEIASRAPLANECLFLLASAFNLIGIEWVRVSQAEHKDCNSRKRQMPRAGELGASVFSNSLGLLRVLALIDDDRNDDDSTLDYNLPER